MAKVLIASADPVVVANLSSAVDSTADYETCTTVSSAAQLHEALRKENPPIVLVDENLPAPAIHRVCQEIVRQDPAVGLVLVSRAVTTDVLESALMHGARGVLHYPVVTADLYDKLKGAVQWHDLIRRTRTTGKTSSIPLVSTSGKVVLFVGSKGGVGTTIIATHLAWDIARSMPGKSVCVVDLNLESGDVPSYLGVSHRVSVADVARLGSDITAQVITETVTTHPSGLHLLPAPHEIRDVDDVTAESVRQLCNELRNTYDVVVVDGGANVTAHQAAAVQMADEVVQVVTADVPSLRAARRQQDAWDSLGVSPKNPLRVLVTKFSRKNEIQVASADELIEGRRLKTVIPAMFAKLQVSINTRSPEEVKDKGWWNTLRAVGAEIDVLNVAGQSDTSGPTTGADQLAGAVSDRGAVSIENVGLLPVAALFLVLVFQLGVMGMNQFWVNQTANIAARDAAVGNPLTQEAGQRIPEGVLTDMTVRRTADGVEVTRPSGLFVAKWLNVDITLTAHRAVADERTDR